MKVSQDPEQKKTPNPIKGQDFTKASWLHAVHQGVSNHAFISGDTLDGAPIHHTHTHTDTFTHNQITTHVFVLEEESGGAAGNPQSKPIQYLVQKPISISQVNRQVQVSIIKTGPNFW